jgi:DNA-binding protein YbaB
MTMTNLATLATALLAISGATAFTTPRCGNMPLGGSTSNIVTTSTTTSSSLNLFGSKPKDESAPQQPGMMDQLAMFKKAQELAQKKNALDKELAEEKIVGSAAEGKIQITIKYVPPQLPVNPTPGYEAAEVDIDEEYLGSVSADDLSASLVEAIRDGENKASERVAEKYKSLEEDMRAIMGGGAPQ